MGAKLPEKDMYEAVRSTVTQARVFRTGDCDSPGIVQAAVYSGHKTARALIEGTSAKFRLEAPVLPGS